MARNLDFRRGDPLSKGRYRLERFSATTQGWVELGSYRDLDWRHLDARAKTIGGGVADLRVVDGKSGGVVGEWVNGARVGLKGMVAK